MTGTEVEALIFRALFENNNKARKLRGLEPLNDNPSDTRYGYKAYRDLRLNMKGHVESVYKAIEPYLDK